MGRLSDLARKASRWLSRGDDNATLAATGAIEADRFDELTWRDTYDQAGALQDLVEDLGQSHNYAADLVRDVFTAAYKATPEVRDAADVDPTRAVNRQIMASLLDSPEFSDLRAETTGDPYASAMATLAMAPTIREMLTRAEEAQRAAEAAAAARQDAEEKATGVAAAMAAASDAAGDDDDSAIPDDAADAVEAAIAAAQAADAAADQAEAEARVALAAATPGMRAAGRRAAELAAEAAREEAALMTAWGISPGKLQRMSFEERARLARRLRSGRLGEFASLIGRFRTMAQAERARRVEGAPGEYVGVTLGDDVSRAIPSEIAMLGVPALRAVFAARLAEGRLMQYETRGDERAGKGAIVACVDTSTSMRDAHTGRDGTRTTREAWAKALTLALLDQARSARPRRDFAAVLFASRTECKAFRFPVDREPAIADVVEMAETFFGGGTNWEVPLSAAAELLDAEYSAAGRQRGDVVFVTDGECGVGEDWMRTWQEAKARLGFRVFGVAIGDDVNAGPGSALDALCDNLRTLDDLADPGAARDMFRVV